MPERRPGLWPRLWGAGAVGKGEDEMKDQARRQLLPGWTKIYCLALAIGLVSGVKDLFTVTKAYMERWQELIRWVALGDMLFRAVGILLSCLLLWMIYRRDQRFLPLFTVDYICRFMLAFMSIVVLRVPGVNGLLSLLVPSLWLTYFHFSKKFRAIFCPQEENAAGQADQAEEETAAASAPGLPDAESGEAGGNVPEEEDETAEGAPPFTPEAEEEKD